MLGGLALIVAMSGVAVAAMPGSDGTLSVCVTKDGDLKAIDAEAGKTCHGTQSRANLVTDSSNIFSRLSTVQSPVVGLGGGSSTVLLDRVQIARGESYVAVGRVTLNHEQGFTTASASCVLYFDSTEEGRGRRLLDVASGTVQREHTVILKLFGVEPPSDTAGELLMQCTAHSETIGQVQATLALIK